MSLSKRLGLRTEAHSTTGSTGSQRTFHPEQQYDAKRLPFASFEENAKLSPNTLFLAQDLTYSTLLQTIVLTDSCVVGSCKTFARTTRSGATDAV